MFKTLAAALVAGLSTLMLAPAAWALPYTLLAPVPIDGSNNGGTGVVGVIRPVTDFTGAILLSDGIVNAGFLGQDVLAVDFVLDAGSAPVDAFSLTVGTSLFFQNPVGAGAFDDVGSGDIAPTAVLADSTIAFQGLFTFAVPLQAGETSVRLFLTYDPEGQIIGLETVSFMVSSGTDFTVQGIVPEPQTLLLVAGGLAVLAAHSRGRRNFSR
jgi:hypothetical protein